ncbi:uncharacterized protein LOC135956746 [Calliphora vicina]|uniref:uncharacterized protein LOC135956746 n=1 Tax=Calliphora vicina TaxID=7373 RepID=UPI00325B9821
MVMMMMVTHNVNAKPQDAGIFEDIASKGLTMAGSMAEMVGNAGMISKQTGFEVPFGKANSGTQIGTGAAFRNDDDDSSEEDRRRRKRHTQDLKRNYYDDIFGEESLLALPHLHRGKRSPCHHGGSGGGTGTGTNDDNIAADGDDIDLAERRRRAYARRRKAAARKKATNAKKTTRKTNNRRNKSLVNDEVQQTLTRRKRQSEVDDLNQNMTAASKDFSQQAQQIADKIRSVVENLMNSMNDMAQKFKQHLTGQNTTTTEEI